MDVQSLARLDAHAITTLREWTAAGTASQEQLTWLIRLLRRYGMSSAVPDVLRLFAETQQDSTADGGFVLLHIGKTGGTFTRSAVARNRAADCTICLSHDYSLLMALTAWPRRLAVFGIRSPEQLFVSGFYSRKRCGQPRHNVPWSPAERAAFAQFGTPNALAEALSAPELSVRAAAEAAMANVRHIQRGLRWYLGSVDELRAHASRVGFILRQEHLQEDLELFLSRAGGGDIVLPPSTPIARHSVPPGLDLHLSDRALENLMRVYAEDFALYRECLAWSADPQRAANLQPPRIVQGH